MLSAAPRASLTLPSCSPNYPRASRIGWTHARHCPFLNYTIDKFCQTSETNKILFSTFNISVREGSNITQISAKASLLLLFWEGCYCYFAKVYICTVHKGQQDETITACICIMKLLGLVPNIECLLLTFVHTVICKVEIQ